MRKSVLYNILILLLFTGAAASAAPVESVTLDAHPSEAALTIGDSLTVVVTLAVPEGHLAGEPYLRETPPLVDIGKLGHRTETVDSGSTREIYDFLVYVLSPDTLTIGPFVSNFATADGDTGTAVSQSLTFIVDGVIEDPASQPPPEPKPNRLPLRIDKRGFPLWLAALIAVALVAVVALFLYLRRKKALRAVSPPSIEIIDEVEVFEAIRRLNLHEKGEIRDLYIRISDAMRGFLHRNLELEAMYETSEEIFEYLSREKIDSETYEKLRAIFGESDMVKFAKYRPSVELTGTIVDRALIPVKSILEEIEREKERLAAEEAAKENVAETVDPVETVETVDPVDVASDDSGGDR